MKYDIICVGYEFMRAEELYQLKQYKEALMHYKNAVKHYEYADNEYLLSPDTPYQVIECGRTTDYPSPLDMVLKSYSRIEDIKKDLK